LELENLSTTGDESNFAFMAQKQKIKLQKKLRQIKETYGLFNKKIIKYFYHTILGREVQHIFFTLSF
jgi:hypothetical protein